MVQPNILVIMCDQMKATASHLYGNTFCRTPNMARLAEEGVLYQHAFTPHPLCVPARVSFWTGQYSHTHGSRRNETKLPAQAPHPFRAWKAAGYHTGLIGKNHCFEAAEDLALFDTWCEISHYGRQRPTRGMDWFRPEAAIDAAHSVRHNLPYQTPHFGYATSNFPLTDYSTGLVAGQTVRFLEAHQNEPFALWVSFPDPHTPYEVPEQYAIPPEEVELPPSRDGEFDESAPERNRVLHRILGYDEDPPEHVYNVVGVYHGMVEYLDDALGHILDTLDRLQLSQQTIVVFCADHGDFGGEHRMMRKGGAFYDCLTRVPLMVAWPGTIPQGVVEDSLVNLVDVVPTLLQLQGLDIPAAMQGDPLPGATDAPGREAAFSEYGAGGPFFTLDDLARLPQPYGLKAGKDSLQWREAEGRRKMIRTRQYKYVHDPMGDKDELYHIEGDPWELTNVVDDPAHAPALADLRLRLLDWSVLTEDARPVPLPEDNRPHSDAMQLADAR